MKTKAIVLAIVLIGCKGSENVQVLADSDRLALSNTQPVPAEAPAPIANDNLDGLDLEATTPDQVADSLSAEELWTPISDDSPSDAGLEPAVDNSLTVQEFAMRRGESLAHFARWSGLTVETIADSSNLSLNGNYPVGTIISVPLTTDELAKVETARDSHHLKRVEGYLASRGGSSGSEFYEVRSGDSAWTIAKSHFGIPVWLLESYNPSVDLERLQPGQQLMVPVIDDVVVSAE